MFSCRECMSIVQQIAPCLLGEGHRVLFFASASAGSWIYCLVCIGWVTLWCDQEVMRILYYLCSTHHLSGFQFGKLSHLVYPQLESWNYTPIIYRSVKCGFLSFHDGWAIVFTKLFVGESCFSLHDLFQCMRIRCGRLPCVAPIFQCILELLLLAKIDYYGWITFPPVSMKSDILSIPSLRGILMCIGVCLS